MSRIKPFLAVSLLAALVAVPRIHAQGSSTSATPSEPAKQAAPATTTTHPSSSTHSTSKHSTPKVDLNAASREQLMKLHGINQATADKIIAARPFKSKDELVSKNLITKKEYEAISAHVMVKQEHMATSTSTSK